MEKEQIKEMEIFNFKNFYKGISEDIQNEILNKYVYGTPFTKNINEKLICTPFELLFMLAAMLVEDNSGIFKYDLLGYTRYKELGYKNNPYDFSWFEEDIDENIDILTYLQKTWIPENWEEFKNIYDICFKYKNVLTISNIWDFYEKVFDNF